MKTTCIITNFNYEKFVISAVYSVINQTTKFDEIIVVDDCSTDNSIPLLEEKFAGAGSIKIVKQETNQGQLASFQAGYALSSGDLIFFLDADDMYQEKYLETALDIYKKHPECDFLACTCSKFQNDIPNLAAISNRMDNQSFNCQDLGYSTILTLNRFIYIGSETSGLSMRRKILGTIFPIPYLEDWRTRADDCLVFGASIVGTRKFQLDAPLVWYRIHDKNNFYENKSHRESVVYYRRQIALNRLFLLLTQRMNYGSNLSCIAPFEFKTISNPNYSLFFLYLGIFLKSQENFRGKLHGVLVMIKCLLNRSK